MPGRDRDSEELRAVAPLVAVDGDVQHLIGAVTLVEYHGRTIGVTSAELLRPHHGRTLRVFIDLDGSRAVDVASVAQGRYAGVALVELGTPVPAGAGVKPLTIDHVCATTDTRGAPAGILAIVPVDGKLQRVLVAVHVDADDGGGMSDTITRLATPLDPAHVDVDVEGAPVFAWFPPDPALGRKGEVLAVAIAYPYRARTAKPRDLPVIAELVALDDLGRALISANEHDTRPELKQVAGEIVEKDGTVDPLAGLDDA